MRKVSALTLGLVFAGCSSAPKDDADNAPIEGPADGSSGETAEAPQDGSADFDSAQESLSLEQQKRKFLVEGHLDNARALKDRLRLEEAELEVAAALELDPDNVEAKRLLADIGALLGRPSGEYGAGAQELNRRWDIRYEQLKAEAQDSFRKAQVLLARGDYDGAIAELTITLNSIRWSPYSIDWEGLDTRAEALLAEAKDGREQALEAEQRLAQERAWEELQARERANAERQQALIDALMSDAIDEFQAGNYDESQELARQVLKQDPRNEKARELSDAAFRAGRKKVREDYLVEKRERFKLWKEYLRETKIPHTGTITPPEEEYWSRITELREGRGRLDVEDVEPPEDTRLREQLANTRIPGLAIEDEESLDAVVDIIRTYTGLPIVVDPAGENAAIDEGVLYTYDLKNPLTVEQALNILAADSGPEVTWTIRHEAVLLTTREKARGKPTVINHDVQDLVFGLTDFLGPRIDRLRLLDELEDDDGGGPFGGIGERPNLIEMSSLTTLIQENVAVGSWEDDGVSIDEGEGYVLVVHTPKVQAQVRRFLDDLRRFTSSLVTIESKFLTIEDNFLQEIGVDWRGLDNPGAPFTDLDDVTNGLEDQASQGLDNLGSGADGAGASGAPSAGFFYDDGLDGDFKGRAENFFADALGSALSTFGGITLQYTFLNDLQLSTILTAVEKSQQLQLVNDQILSVHNSQRAYVSVINQRAYVQDFDVEVAQFQSIADPQINVLTEGVVLDVRPTILHHRKYMRLEIQPTVANVVALRPFATTLGAGGSPVEFQLPELEVQSVFTTAVIPDGGSILLGGLSNIRNIERRSEVPWLGRIPLVGFFFKQEGHSDENRSLMILIRARIADVKDELARLDER